MPEEPMRLHPDHQYYKPIGELLVELHKAARAINSTLTNDLCIGVYTGGHVPCFYVQHGSSDSEFHDTKIHKLCEFLSTFDGGEKQRRIAELRQELRALEGAE